MSLFLKIRQRQVIVLDTEFRFNIYRYVSVVEERLQFFEERHNSKQENEDIKGWHKNILNRTKVD